MKKQMGRNTAYLCRGAMIAALYVVLTLLSAVAVEFIFYFKLEKINMAEALKSVE